jgi:putative transposase
MPTGPKEARSTTPSIEEEAIIVAFRKHTLLPLDDCLYSLQATIPHLTRSLHRCLQRHTISRLPASPITRAATGIVPSARAPCANDGLRIVRPICCRCRISMSFTVPVEVAKIAFHNKAVVYAILFEAVRALTVVDAFTREALAIDVVQGIKGTGGRSDDVDRAVAGAPKTIRVDNGPEFISKALDRWEYENGVTLDFSRPGKPTHNAFGSFNGRLRDECLNTHWFSSMEDARAKINAWRRDYNESRAHTSLGRLTPIEYAAAAATKAAE